MRLYSSLLLTIALLFPGLASAAGSIMFDRNGNGVPDIRFGEAQDGGGTDNANIVSYDNDEDGTYDFGFLSGGNVHNDGEIYAAWIDRNGNGSVQKNEVRTLPWTLPWATFPSSFTVTHVTNPNGSIDHFMDYTEDDAMFDQLDRDADGDGAIESMTLGLLAEGSGVSQALLQLRDTNNDGFFDKLFFLPEVGDEVLISFTKAQQRHLSVLHYPQ